MARTVVPLDEGDSRRNAVPSNREVNSVSAAGSSATDSNDERCFEYALIGVRTARRHQNGFGHLRACLLLRVSSYGLPY